jgi:hypothetical protein
VAEQFVGGNSAGGFVGGGLTTQLTNNRQFRALLNADVPAGGSSTQATGTPRRIATSLKIAFDYPVSDAQTQLIESSGPAIQRVAFVRPELQSVIVGVDPAGVAMLTGSVPDAATRRLATNLVRLRPGVRRVRNEILIWSTIGAPLPASH